jgi:hypothetical protein
LTGHLVDIRQASHRLTMLAHIRRIQ